MKKLMLGAAVLAIGTVAASPSFANEPAKKQTRTVTDVVGYVKTETTYNDRDAEFMKFDVSGDGAINFREFQNAALLENEYEIFNMNDTNNDELLTIDEYRVFSKWGPERAADGPAQTSFNFNKPGVQAK